MKIQIVEDGPLHPAPKMTHNYRYSYKYKYKYKL